MKKNDGWKPSPPIYYEWRPYKLTSELVKTAVSTWGRDRGMMTVCENAGLVDGRLDVVLVPTSIDSPIFKGTLRLPDANGWTRRLGIIGVEVKVDKQDFKNGLEKGQFDRYDKDLSGLYLAGPPDVVTMKNVPAQFGVLQVGKDGRIVCRRNPQWKTQPIMDHDKAWRLLFAVHSAIQYRYRELEREKEEVLNRIKSAAGQAIAAAVTNVRNS